jgi:hypothetical protein
MLAAAVAESHRIPLWGAILLALLGVAYLGLGLVLPRLLTVLSMTVAGCVFGMTLSSWLPLSPVIVVIAGGLVVGGLAAFFQKISHAVLVAVVLASVLATLTALVVGPTAFVPYIARAASSTTDASQISGPDLSRDPVLAAALTGLLIGATVAATRFQFSRTLVTAAQGAALILLGLVELVRMTRTTGGSSLGVDYPLTLSACWMCLTAIGLVTQRAVDRYKQSWTSPDAGAAGEEEL